MNGIRTSFKHLLLIVLGCLLLTACDGNRDQCVEADDWGFPKIHVDSHHELTSKESVYTQYVSWATGDSGEVILDAKRVPLIITIPRNNQWTSWLNGLGIPRNQYCIYKTSNCSGNDCSVVDKSQGTAIACDPKNPLTPPDMMADCMVPCWLRDGYGLYMMSTPNPDALIYKTSSGTDSAGQEIYQKKELDILKTLGPAATSTGKAATNSVTGVIGVNAFDTSTSPVDGGSTVTKHLGLTDSQVASDPMNDRRFIYLTHDLPTNIDPNLKTGNRLYFKIVDRFYADNNGGYDITIKSGTRSATPQPIEYIVQVVESITDLVVESVYKGIVANTTFIRGIQALLILYIALYGLKFILGMDNTNTVGDFVARIFKVSIIIQLVSPTSWEFFYGYLFTLFTDGVTSILGLLAAPFNNYDPTSPWYSIDAMLHSFMSYATMTKLFSIIFSHPFIGIFIVIMIIIAMGLFVMALAQAMMIYLHAYLMMGILLLLFPVMLPFILFQKTASFWEEWVSQMLAIAIQLILLFAMLGLFSMLIMSFMQQTLGYRVCWSPIFGKSSDGPHAFFTDVDERAGPIIGGALTSLPWGFYLPNVTDNIVNFYKGKDPDTDQPIYIKRYQDAPYLDIVPPIAQTDPERIKIDTARFKRVRDDGKYYINVLDSLTFILSVYLAWMFFGNILPNLASALKGGLGGFKESSGIFNLGGFDGLRNMLLGTNPGENPNMTGGKGIAGFFGKQADQFSKGSVLRNMGASMASSVNPFRDDRLSGRGKLSSAFGRRGGLFTGLSGAFTATATDSFNAASGRNAQNKAAEMEKTAKIKAIEQEKEAVEDEKQKETDVRATAAAETAAPAKKAGLSNAAKSDLQRAMQMRQEAQEALRNPNISDADRIAATAKVSEADSIMSRHGAASEGDAARMLDQSRNST